MNTEVFDTAKIIKQIRDNKNISQERLGKKLGITGKAISQYELKKTHPPIDNLIKILEFGGYKIKIVKKS